MRSEPRIIFDNQPDIGYIETVLLKLLAKQEGLECDYEVVATLKEEYQGGSENDVQGNGAREDRRVGEASPA